jgi:hypothetical protein
MKYLILFISIFIQGKLISQTFSIPDLYYDKCIIDSIVDRQNIKNYIVLQTMLQNDSLIVNDNDELIVSFLIWTKLDSTCFKMIHKNYISNIVKIRDNEIFNYKYLKHTGVDKSECTLKFAEPGIVPINSEIVIVKIENYHFYFGFNYGTKYVENKEKVIFRREFVEIIKGKIKPIIYKFKFEKVYVRPPLFIEE